ncbi:PTS sugar transporter subunit IIA [Salmonella enterica subsp. enterica]|nr:PTS sugar transporter subunit IIA [Salmonella enterica subsp. enterica]
MEQFGPYFVIAPGSRCRMAARKKVKKTGFSLVTLKSRWSSTSEDNDPVDILITMAAVDANTTRSAHQRRSSTCLKTKLLDRLRACRTAQEVLILRTANSTRQLKKELKMSLPRVAGRAGQPDYG